jgi:hypothetical protein
MTGVGFRYVREWREADGFWLDVAAVHGTEHYIPCDLSLVSAPRQSQSASLAALGRSAPVHFYFGLRGIRWNNRAPSDSNAKEPAQSREVTSVRGKLWDHRL